MVGSDFVSHVLFQSFGPAEVPDFYAQVDVQENVQTFEVAVQNGRTARVQIEHPLRDLHSKSPPIFPSDVVLFVLKIGPK